MAAMIPIRATTIISSTRVNPPGTGRWQVRMSLRRFFIILVLHEEAGACRKNVRRDQP
jgi:hypothetical protein